MAKKIEIKQVWHHIEDNLSPSKTQKIRQVMDLITDEPFIELDFKNYHSKMDKESLKQLFNSILTNLDPKDFHDLFKGVSDQIFGLQIIGRNKSQELAFIHDKEMLYINIGDGWPKEMDFSGFKGIKNHIKLEIDYLESYPHFEHSWKGYKSRFMIWWPIRPEFTITLPLGMYMSSKADNLTLFCYRVAMLPDGEITHSIWENIRLKEPDVTKNGERNVYTYVIKDEDFKNIYPDDAEIPFIVFRGSYQTRHAAIHWGIFLFSFILFVFSIAEIQSTLLVLNIELPDIPFLVILGSYSFFCFELMRLNYILPMRTVIWGSIIFSLSSIGLISSVYVLNNFLHFNLQQQYLIVIIFFLIVGILPIINLILKFKNRK